MDLVKLVQHALALPSVRILLSGSGECTIERDAQITRKLIHCLEERLMAKNGRLHSICVVWCRGPVCVKLREAVRTKVECAHGEELAVLVVADIAGAHRNGRSG